MSRSLERGIVNVKMLVIFLGLTHNEGATPNTQITSDQDLLF